MVYKCCVVDCCTGLGEEESKGIAVFGFPDKEKQPDRRRAWVKFVNRKDFPITSSTKICELHFEDRFIHRGKRTTLNHHLNPIPSIESYSENVPPSIKPTPSPPTRKPPTQRRGPNSPAEDELKRFLAFDVIGSFEQLDETYASEGLLFKRGEDYVVFYELVNNELGIPFVKAAIRVDEKLHVKLFSEGNPVPQPDWFRKGKNENSKLTSRGSIPNLLNHIHCSAQKTLLDELLKIRNMKPKGRPPYSADILRFALKLRYTSKQAYQLLLEEFPFPCLSLLQKLKEGGKDAMKAVRLLLEKGEIDSDVALLLDEMILEKEESFQGGSFIGADERGELFKGILTFMIVGLRKNIPSVIRAIPEVTISGSLVLKHIEECLRILSDSGFKVRAVISDDHSTNVAAYSSLLGKYNGDHSTGAIVHPFSSNQRIYLMYDAVHLIKNVRNNLLNYKRFIFPEFKFEKFRDDINVPAGEIRWKNLLDVYDHDQHLDAHLKFAPKLTYRACHPGNNKQNVPYALAVFHQTTSAAIRKYFPENEAAASFLSLIDTWWTIVNSKQAINTNNRLGNAAIPGDGKPEFLRKFADWVDEWFDSQISNFRKFTLSAQTSSALASTCRALASLMEDLLNEGYDHVLTARFLTDFLERRFSRYRQMSGGRFLVALREVLNSAQICMMTSLLKAGINFWEEDLRDETHDHELEKLVMEASTMQFEGIQLKDESMEVVAYIGGYIVKSLLDKDICSKCSLCKMFLCDHNNQANTEYLNLVSRGGLKIPSSSLLDYTASTFGMLQMLEPVLRRYNVNERSACEHLFNLYGPAPEFVCDEHNEWAGKVANRVIINIFYNNAQKESKDKKRKDSVEGFKKRQRTK